MEANHVKSILIFRVGPYYFSVDAKQVEAIISPPAITNIPFAPNSIAGSCIFRGNVALVISLHQKFGLSDANDLAGKQLLFTILPSGNTAFGIDEVIDVTPGDKLNWQEITTDHIEKRFNQFVLRENQIILHTDFSTLHDLPDGNLVKNTLFSLSHTPAADHAASPSVISSTDKTNRYQAQNKPLEEVQKDDLTPSSEKHDDVNLLDQEPAITGAESAKTRLSMMPELQNMASQDAFDRSLELDKNKTGVANRRESMQKRLSRPVVRQHFKQQKNHPAGTFHTRQQQEIRKKMPLLLFGGICLFIALFLSYWMISEKPHEQILVDIKIEDSVAPVLNEEIQNNTKKQEIIPAVDHTEISDGTLAEKNSNQSPEGKEEETEVTITPADAVEDEVLRFETEEFTLIVERPEIDKPLLDTEHTPQKRPEKSYTEHTHIVVTGDTLWDIAAAYLGDPFQFSKLAKNSDIKNPHFIYPGDRIRIIKKNQ